MLHADSASSESSRVVVHIVALSSFFLESEMLSFSKRLSSVALCPEPWNYPAHPHIHPVEFENLGETNFTELQSVPALHPPALIRHDPIRYETEALLDPNLGTHVLQQPVSPSADSELRRPPSQISAELQISHEQRAFTNSQTCYGPLMQIRKWDFSEWILRKDFF